MAYPTKRIWIFNLPFAALLSVMLLMLHNGNALSQDIHEVCGKIEAFVAPIGLGRTYYFFTPYGTDEEWVLDPLLTDTSGREVDLGPLDGQYVRLRGPKFDEQYCEFSNSRRVKSVESVDLGKSFLAGTNNSAPGHLVIVSGVHIIPENPRVGETVVVSFRLKNATDSTVTIRRLVAAVRGPKACGRGWNAPHADFPAVENITLKPRQEYYYGQARVFDTPGDYFVEPVMQDTQGRWGGIRPFPRVWFNVQDAGGHVPPPECLIVEKDVHLSTDVARQGEKVEVEFRVRNNGLTPVHIKRLVAAVRGPNGPTLGWSAPQADFPAVSDISLAPGETYTYRQQRSFDVPGEYFVEPALMDARGQWGGLWPWPRKEFSVVSTPFCGMRVSTVMRTGPLTGFFLFGGGVLPCGQRAPVLVEPTGNSPPLPSSGFVQIFNPRFERIEPPIEIQDFPERATLRLTHWTRVEKVTSCGACGLATQEQPAACVLARCTPQRVLFSPGLLSGTTSPDVSGCIAYVDVIPENMGGNVKTVSFFKPLRDIPFIGPALVIGPALGSVTLLQAEKWATEVNKAVNGEQSFLDAAWNMFVDVAVDAGARYVGGRLVGNVLGIHIDLSKNEAVRHSIIGPILSEIAEALEETASEWVAWYEGNRHWTFANLPHCIFENCYSDYRSLLKDYALAYQYIYDYKVIYTITKWCIAIFQKNHAINQQRTKERKSRAKPD